LRFEILVPLHDNEGVAVDVRKIFAFIVEVRQRYQACRTQPTAPHLGWWAEEATADAAVFRDWTVMVTVDTDPAEEHVQWFRDLKRRMEQEFRQIVIYVAVVQIHWL
jgi:hypothetical protein